MGGQERDAGPRSLPQGPGAMGRSRSWCTRWTRSIRLVSPAMTGALSQALEWQETRRGEDGSGAVRPP